MLADVRTPIREVDDLRDHEIVKRDDDPASEHLMLVVALALVEVVRRLGVGDHRLRRVDDRGLDGVEVVLGDVRRTCGHQQRGEHHRPRRCWHRAVGEDRRTVVIRHVLPADATSREPLRLLGRQPAQAVHVAITASAVPSLLVPGHRRPGLRARLHDAKRAHQTMTSHPRCDCKKKLFGRSVATALDRSHPVLFLRAATHRTRASKNAEEKR